MLLLEYGDIKRWDNYDDYKKESWNLLSADGKGPWHPLEDHQAWKRFKPSTLLSDLIENPLYRIRKTLQKDPSFQYSITHPDDHLGLGYPFEKMVYEIAVVSIHYQLPIILTALKGDIAGKNILDLGCGSVDGTVESSDPTTNPEWQPWLCRMLYKLGAHPIGVDIGNLSQESFKAQQINLLAANSLSQIPTHFIDLAHSRQLFSSPQLLKMRQFKELSKANLSKRQIGEHLAQLLFPQVYRVLKPDHAFVYYADLRDQLPSAEQNMPKYWPFQKIRQDSPFIHPLPKFLQGTLDFQSPQELVTQLPLPL